MKIVLNTASYTVQRRGSGSYDAAGQYTPGDLTTLSVVANVQPLAGKTLLAETYGDRAADAKLVLTNTELRTVRSATVDASAEDAPAGHGADRILIDGEWYVIETVEKWTAFAPTHYECIALRQSKGA